MSSKTTSEFIMASAYHEVVSCDFVFPRVLRIQEESRAPSCSAPADQVLAPLQVETATKGKGKGYTAISASEGS